MESGLGSAPERGAAREGPRLVRGRTATDWQGAGLARPGCPHPGGLPVTPRPGLSLLTRQMGTLCRTSPASVQDVETLIFFSLGGEDRPPSPCPRGSLRARWLSVLGLSLPFLRLSRPCHMGAILRGFWKVTGALGHSRFQVLSF